MADLHRHARAPGLTGKFPGFFRTGRERLFAKHMFASAKRTLNILRVMQGWNTDIHDVDTVGSERFIETAVNRYIETELLRFFLRPHHIVVDDRRDGGARKCGIHLGVYAAHETESGYEYFLHE